ncbi:MAG: hypothetical protein AB8B82_12155 [Roseovarius sp.]
MAKPTQLPGETFVFVCMEDFSVGSLIGWDDLVEFQRNRSDFWQATPLLDLPDGSKADYFVWHQTLPRCDLVGALKSGMSFDDIPEPLQLEQVAAKATSIEIWSDRSVQGYAFLWYLSIALEGMGVDRNAVSLCVFHEDIFGKRPKKFWSDMLLDRTERGIPAVPLNPTDWQLLVDCWNAITMLPQPIDPSLMPRVDEYALHAFEVLKNRHPNRATGLTNLQARLLVAVKPDWSKMARIVGDVMVAGWDENDRVGDGVLQAELEKMARMDPPLIEIDGTGAMRFCQVRLTPEGATKQQVQNS